MLAASGLMPLCHPELGFTYLNGARQGLIDSKNGVLQADAQASTCSEPSEGSWTASLDEGQSDGQRGSSNSDLGTLANDGPAAFKEQFSLDRTYSRLKVLDDNRIAAACQRDVEAQEAANGALYDECLRIEEQVSDELKAHPRWSVGAALHPLGICRPCAWVWKARGCRDGKKCDFCHLCSVGATKARRKAKETARKRNQDQDQMVPSATQEAAAGHPLQLPVSVGQRGQDFSYPPTPSPNSLRNADLGPMLGRADIVPSRFAQHGNARSAGASPQNSFCLQGLPQFPAPPGLSPHCEAAGAPIHAALPAGDQHPARTMANVMRSLVEIDELLTQKLQKHQGMEQVLMLQQIERTTRQRAGLVPQLGHPAALSCYEQVAAHEAVSRCGQQWPTLLL
mmetsp:Transcript_18237/g.42482  ORF Transcript_18237/g.42482 Transcript_18237/m.42482 type:complete len:396 (+) Transcript_18237:95-1282(+)